MALLTAPRTRGQRLHCSLLQGKRSLTGDPTSPTSPGAHAGAVWKYPLCAMLPTMLASQAARVRGTGRGWVHPAVASSKGATCPLCPVASRLKVEKEAGETNMKTC